jgi:hypothetical protein
VSIIPLLLAALNLLPSTPYAPADLAAWHGMLNRQCPGHHIDDWMPERNKVDLIDTFVTSLSPDVRVRFRKATEKLWRGTCAGAEGDGAGSCEKIVDIHVLRNEHLLGRFTAYACTRAICSEPALCERPEHSGGSRNSVANVR